MKKQNTIISLLILLFVGSFLLNSCGSGKKVKDIFKPVDLAKEPLDPDERARRNIEEGRGISIGTFGGNKKTTYEFSTANPMWRASLETLDFLPLATVDYSGGIIITDWYSENSSKQESIKISLRFLGNDVRSESLKVIVHKKKCTSNQNCIVSLLNSSKIEEELHSVILRKAALLDKESKKKN